MADHTITVSLSNGAVSVDPSNMSIERMDPPQTVTISWVPETGATFTLKNVVFLRPVGPNHPISVPTLQSDGSFEATDTNDNHFAQPDRFKYLVLVDHNSVVIPSPDPEIVNEPMGGVKDFDGN